MTDRSQLEDARTTLTYYRGVLKSLSKRLNTMQAWIGEIESELDDVIGTMGPHPLNPPEEVRIADIEPSIVSTWGRTYNKEQGQ